jgi:hypothetical protein
LAIESIGFADAASAEIGKAILQPNNTFSATLRNISYDFDLMIQDLKAMNHESANDTEVFWLLLQALKDWIFNDGRLICIKEIVIHADSCQPIVSICQLFALGVGAGFHYPGHRARTGPMTHAKGDFLGLLKSEVMKGREISLRNSAVSQKGHEMAPERLINMSIF